jgi:hypothetical protein
VLNIPLAKLSFIITKAREYDVKVEPVDSDPGSNPNDDGDGEILSDYADDPTAEELADAIASLNEDERDELVALLWIGRGDFDKDEWPQALAQAHSELDRPAAEYLMGEPLLGDFLEEAISDLGYSLDDYKQGRL